MNILFITANRLGDAVLSTGVLGALIDQHPAARITVACGPVAAPLFGAIPEVVRVIPMVKQPRYGHWRALWLETIGTSWELVVDLRNSAVSRLLRHRKLQTFRGPQPGEHMVEALSHALHIRPVASPRLWLDDAAIDRARSALPSRTAKLLALAPAANWAGKTWDSGRFAELARRLTAADGFLPDASVAVLASADERAQAAPVLAGLPPGRGIDLIGQGDSLMAAASLSQADLFIGNDSGLMHLAAAIGIPTLGLFGPSLPERYRPWGAKTAYVRTPDDFWTLISGPGYDRTTTGSLMDGLSVDMVTEAAERLWRTVRGSTQ